DLSAETQDGKAVWVNPYGARYPGDGLGAIYISHCPVNSKSELTFQLSNNSEETKVGLYSRAKNFSESAANENFLNAGVTFGTDVVVANNGYTHNLGASASWVNVECKITVKQVNQYVRVELYKNGILKYQSNVILPNAIVANVNDSFIVPYLKKNIYIKKVEFMDQAEVPFDPEYTGGETGDPVGTPYAETAANWQYSHLFNEGADEPLDVSGAEINTGNLHALQSIYGNSRLDSYGLVLDNTAAPDIIAISNSPVNLHSESIFKFTGNGNFCHVIRGQADQSSFLVAGSRLRDEQVWLYIQDHTGTSLHEYDVCEASANGSEWLNQECRIVVDFVNDKARVKLYKNDVLEGKIEHSLDDPSSFQGTSSGIYLESNVAVKQYRFSEETTEPFEPATLVYGTENNDNPDYGNTLMYHDFTASPDGLLSSALPQQRNAAFSFYVWMQPTFELPHDVNGEDWTVPSILSGSGIVGMEDGFAGQVLSEVSDCIIELEFQLPEGEQDKDLSLCLWFRGGYGFWYFEKIKTYCLLFPGEGIDYVVITEGHPLYDTSVLNKMKVRLEGDTVTYYANDIQLGQASPGIDEAVDDPRMHGLAGGFCTGVFYKSYRISPLE
ncbi:MAG: hypothetical protein GY754_22980, partial [bacterium]|nr:hypothetical protein [bacterium]